MSCEEAAPGRLRLAVSDTGPGIPPEKLDRLFVPFQSAYHVLPTVGIQGEVEHPGAYPIVAGKDRLSDLIRWAGGFGPQANRSAVQLMRGMAARSDAEKAKEDPELARISAEFNF